MSLPDLFANNRRWAAQVAADKPSFFDELVE